MIVQLSANETRKKRIHPRLLNWDWPAALLLLACVLVASARLVATEATEHLLLVSFLALIGCAIGLALGRSFFPAWAGAFFGLIAGAFFVPWQLGLAYFAGQEWEERLRELANRLNFAATQFVSGENVEDPLLFVTAMAIVFWLLGVNAGYRLARKGDIWGALIPFGLAALITQIYNPGEAWKAGYIALFLLCLLFLLARLQLLKQRKGWETTRTQIPFEISAGFSGLAFVSAATLVLLAWVTPALASSLDSVESFWSTVTSPWRAIGEELNRAMYSLEGGPSQVTREYGEQMLLGRGISRSPGTLFTVEVIREEQPVLRHYWRDRVYDHYKNGKWSSTYIGNEIWADANSDAEDIEGRSTGSYLFTAGSSLEILHTAPQPISIDQDVNYTFAVNNDGSEDLSALLAIKPLLGGESYEVQASTAVPSAEQLRAAGTAYPSWVRERYLQFSSEISPRTLELARSLAEGHETPYDIAAAITDYLRNEIEYINQLPIPPVDTEPIDWLLFEQKQGFCNYYATAEVVMLRSLGIPSRLAVGYVDGEVENLGGDRMRFTVHQRDAHAWPEVFFPGIGWVEFEPTANQQPLLREPGNGQFDLEHPIQEEEQLPPVEEPVIPLPISESANENGLLAYLWIIAVGALLIGVASVFLWRYRDQILMAFAVVVDRLLKRFDVRGPQSLTALINNARLPVLTRAYTQINQALHWLGATPKPGDTPRQRAAALSLLLPELRTEINALVEDYQDDLYGEARIEREERATVIMDRIRETAERLRFRRWLEYVLSKIRR